MRGCLNGTLLGLTGVGGLLVLWYLATDVLTLPDSLAHRFSPVAAFASLPDLVVNSDLFTHIATSLTRILVGLAIAIVATG